MFGHGGGDELWPREMERNAGKSLETGLGQVGGEGRVAEERAAGATPAPPPPPSRRRGSRPFMNLLVPQLFTARNVTETIGAYRHIIIIWIECEITRFAGCCKVESLSRVVNVRGK